MLQEELCVTNHIMYTYILLIRITNRVDLAMSVYLSFCPYERCDHGNYKS